MWMRWNRASSVGNSPLYFRSEKLRASMHHCLKFLMVHDQTYLVEIILTYARTPWCWGCGQCKTYVDERHRGQTDVRFLWIYRTKANVKSKTLESYLTAELYERSECCEVRCNFFEQLLWLRNREQAIQLLHELSTDEVHQWCYCLRLQKTEYPRGIDRRILVGESFSQGITQKNTVICKLTVPGRPR